MKKAKKAFEKWKEKMKRRQWAERKFGELDHINKKKLLERNADRLRNEMTAPEKKMSSMLDGMEVDFESQKILGEFIYDFYLPEYKLFIEVDGDYYHGHPDKYAINELNAMQRRVKQNDIIKEKLAKGLKYGLLRFWERDINDDEETVKRTITAYINGYQG